jgi:O-antigen/teichoic acid export membrane protein
MSLNISVFKSILGSTIFKLASSLVAFVSVPLLLKTLGTNDYGIWVTLTTLVAWLNLFDFGSGYSLKNKVTESVVTSDNTSLQSLIAGTIQFYLLSTLVILIVFGLCLFFISAFRENFLLAIIIYLPVILAFPFTLGHFMMQGLKKFNLFNSLLLIQTVIWLLFLLLFKLEVLKPDIYRIGFIYSLLYVLVNFCIFFISLKCLNFNWKELLIWNHFKSSKDSLLVGGRFFLLQVSSLLLFSIGNLMTYNNLQIKAVAQFDTVNKIYLMGMTIFNVLITIYWSEISHAKALNDRLMLRKIQKQLLIFSSLFSCGTIAISFFIPFFINYWTRGMVTVNLNQLWPFSSLVIIQFFAYSGAVFLNAFEDLKGQVILSVIAAAFIIPLAQYFFHIKVGIGSVPLASATLVFPTLIYVLYKSNSCIKKSC